jgi:hypothetical protein
VCVCVCVCVCDHIFSDRWYTTDLIWSFSADPVTSHIMEFFGIRTNIPCRRVNIKYIASRFRLFKSVAITRYYHALL